MGLWTDTRIGQHALSQGPHAQNQDNAHWTTCTGPHPLPQQRAALGTDKLRKHSTEENCKASFRAALYTRQACLLEWRTALVTCGKQALKRAWGRHSIIGGPTKI